MNKTDKILSVNDLSIGYRTGRKVKELLSLIKVEAVKGELVALIGPNGVGKSTFLRSIAGLHRKLAGEIELNGRANNLYSNMEMARLIGFVTAGNPVSQNLTVIELVSLGRFPYTNWIGQLKRNDRLVVQRSVESVGLTGLSYSRMGELSDGEKQRAMIARALAQDPQLLILDEPTAFLDLPNRYELIHLLKKLAADNDKTVIFSTHDLQIALREADKVWLMTSSGLSQGAPEDLIMDGSFARVFAGSPLKFDEAEAGFAYPVAKVLSVRLEGTGRTVEITRKVLHRLNIGIGNGVDTPLIYVSQDGTEHVWVLDDGGSRKSFSSLYELAGFMKKLAADKPG
ncbi:MAG TPA: ABC transporter ATP-binding protein [Bacteroidales bacterium]|nr:ABC transporter ATP-binding protein [Bacteroidales bacterium]